MDKFTVFTNNSIVADFFQERAGGPIEIKWVAAPAIDVLSAAKTAAHQGAVILSNPMQGVRTSQPLFGPSSFDRNTPPPPAGRSAPSVRSINPYLSVLAGPAQGMVDFVSVKNIDEALTLYKKNARLRFVSHGDDTIKAFQAADMEMLFATITAIEAMGQQ
ncbi:MAG: hypothetical protein FWF78_03185 [Defluviitaleaceae bacterium]|nr:hypothetical protein [Defluviitaleaceae bacterium]